MQPATLTWTSVHFGLAAPPRCASVRPFPALFQPVRSTTWRLEERFSTCGPPVRVTLAGLS